MKKILLLVAYIQTGLIIELYIHHERIGLVETTESSTIILKKCIWSSYNDQYKVCHV